VSNATTTTSTKTSSAPIYPTFLLALAPYHHKHLGAFGPRKDAHDKLPANRITIKSRDMIKDPFLFRLSIGYGSKCFLHSPCNDAPCFHLSLLLPFWFVCLFLSSGFAVDIRSKYPRTESRTTIVLESGNTSRPASCVHLLVTQLRWPLERR